MIGHKMNKLYIGAEKLLYRGLGDCYHKKCIGGLKGWFKFKMLLFGIFLFLP